MSMVPGTSTPKYCVSKHQTEYHFSEDRTEELICFCFAQTNQPVGFHTSYGTTCYEELKEKFTKKK